MSHFPKKSLRLLFKAAGLFLIFNYAFLLIPTSALWKVTIFNTLLPDRPRFFRENDLDLLFNTHEIATSPSRDEFKVIVLGNSSTWGFLLTPEETFSSFINASNLTCQGRPIHVYNLGYHKLSVFKDLLLLQRALAYKPDLVIWNVTLNSVLNKDSKPHPIVSANHALAQALVDRYHLVSVEIGSPPKTSPLEGTFLARRNDLARFLKYQLDGIRWQAAGEPESEITPISQDVQADNTYEDLLPPALDPSLIQFEVLKAGVALAGQTPLVIVNEPIQIVTGQNSEIRYNSLYPRWAYNQYHALLAAQVTQNRWNYADLWDLVPATEFTGTAVHRTVAGEQIFAAAIQQLILERYCP